jgi:hypothetical protein
MLAKIEKKIKIFSSQSQSLGNSDAKSLQKEQFPELHFPIKPNMFYSFTSDLMPFAPGACLG